MQVVRPDAPLRWKLGGVMIRSTFAVVAPRRELDRALLGYWAVDHHLLEPAGNCHAKVTIRGSLAGLLLPLLYTRTRLQAGYEQWLTALKAAVEGSPAMA